MEAQDEESKEDQFFAQKTRPRQNTQPILEFPVREASMSNELLAPVVAGNSDDSDSDTEKGKSRKSRRMSVQPELATKLVALEESEQNVAVAEKPEVAVTTQEKRKTDSDVAQIQALTLDVSEQAQKQQPESKE